jgi:hypothetical protein
MAQFQTNSKVYAGNSEVTMFENQKGGLFERPSPDFNRVCLESYRHYLSDAQIVSSQYRNLSFSAYIRVPINDRKWLPESYIGEFTGKEYSVQGDNYLQISYSANKKTFKPDGLGSVLCSYSEVIFLAWVKEDDVSDTGY